MILYLYKLGTNTPALTIKNARSYTADSVTDEDGAVYRPLAEDYELSGKADCSETLRADYRAAHPTQETRLEELETLVAALLLFISGIILSSQLAKDARDFEFQLQTVHQWENKNKS